MKVLISDHQWCEGHARFGDDGWKCKTTGAEIVATTVGRSLHDGPFPLSGSGRVVDVLHLHCPACQPDWKKPNHGTPVKPEQIANVSG